MTKILIDSSAWIHFFRGSSRSCMEAVRTLILDDSTATCGPVVTEVLRGARSNKEEAFLREQLSLPLWVPLQQDDFFEAAFLGRRLRGRGFTVKTIDLLIARACLREKIPLLHDDSDFESVALHTALKTLRP